MDVIAPLALMLIIWLIAFIACFTALSQSQQKARNTLNYCLWMELKMGLWYTKTTPRKNHV